MIFLPLAILILFPLTAFADQATTVSTKISVEVVEERLLPETIPCPLCGNKAHRRDSIYWCGNCLLSLKVEYVSFRKFPKRKLRMGQKEKLITSMGVVFIGMDKTDLPRAGYTDLLLKKHEQKGDETYLEEWLTYSDWTTKETGDMITFYIVNNIVQNWWQERWE